MMRSRTSWREKLGRGERHVIAIPPKMAKRFAGAKTMLVPRPLDVDALLRGVRRGRVVTQSAMRERLARAHAADVT